GSRFAAIRSGHPGVDPYTTAVSDVYQDLYGEGSFTGKGIYDVDAFEQATRGRFPENTLLSHDLIEGNYARAGLATDIEVFDDYPSRYLAYARRKHRWIRGDWQLLRWLGRWVPGPDGPERNRLSPLSRSCRTRRGSPPTPSCARCGARSCRGGISSSGRRPRRRSARRPARRASSGARCGRLSPWRASPSRSSRCAPSMRTTCAGRS